MDVKIIRLSEVINEIPNGGYIVHLPGDHWTGLVVKPHTVLYFDSFGKEVPSKILNEFKNVKKVYASSKQIQHTASTMCGFYVLEFLKNVKNKQQFIDFVDSFSDQPHLNAHQLKGELQKVIPKYMHDQFPDL